MGSRLAPVLVEESAVIGVLQWASRSLSSFSSAYANIPSISYFCAAMSNEVHSSRVSGVDALRGTVVLGLIPHRISRTHRPFSSIGTTEYPELGSEDETAGVAMSKRASKAVEARERVVLEK